MFNAKVQSVLNIVLAGSCLCVPLISQSEPAGKIRVFNLAHVPHRDLLQAEAEVTRIFAAAGMDARWADGSVDDSASLRTDFSLNNSSPTGCMVTRHVRELHLQLLARAPRGVASGILGFSLPCAAFGIDSTIFIDHCEGVIHQTPASFSTVLGYAMAHELGHVLLRSNEHSRTGLMCAIWDKNAWLRAMTSDIPIDRQRARRMRMELFRMESPTP